MKRFPERLTTSLGYAHAVAPPLSMAPKIAANTADVQTTTGAERRARAVKSWEDNSAKLVRFVQQHVQNDAEDIVQDVGTVFLVPEDGLQAAFESVEETRWVPWMFRVARNMAISHGRRHRNQHSRHLYLDADSVYPDLVESQPSPEDQVENAEFIRAIQSVLSPDEFAIVEMQQAGYNNVEIAEVRQCCSKTVQRFFKHLGRTLGFSQTQLSSQDPRDP